jgi:hypothetical protein
MATLLSTAMFCAACDFFPPRLALATLLLGLADWGFEATAFVFVAIVSPVFFVCERFEIFQYYAGPWAFRAWVMNALKIERGIASVHYRPRSDTDEPWHQIIALNISAACTIFA